MNKLLKAIKEASLQSTDESKPTGFFFGEVISVDPLTVNVEQKFTLTEEFLTLTHAVKDYYVDITVSHKTEEERAGDLKHRHHYEEDGQGETEEEQGHKHKYEGYTDYQLVESQKHGHKYKGKKKIMLHHGLKVGETVMLLRVQGGQNYVIIDRLNDPICEGEWI